MSKTIYLVWKFSGHDQLFLWAFEDELAAYKIRNKEWVETYTEVITYELNTIYQ